MVHEVQEEIATMAVQAGIEGLRLMYDFPQVRQSLPITLSILTSTTNHRGVHMSRLVRAAQSRSKSSQAIEDYIRKVCSDVDETQPGSIIRCDFDLPYHDQFVPIRVQTSRNRQFTYSFLVNGITSCPCSRREAGIGHMQRATLSLDIQSSSSLSPNFFGIISKLNECFSSTPVAYLKRSDEAKLVLAVQENSRFVEDVVRECLKRFHDAKRIEVRSQESIHTHEAVARWVKSTSESKNRIDDFQNR